MNSQRTHNTKAQLKAPQDLKIIPLRTLDLDVSYFYQILLPNE